jgi:carbamoyltransferase
VIINLKIYEQITKSVYVVPAVADDGSAQGAAFSILLDEKKSFNDFAWIARSAMPYYGTSYDKGDVFDRLSPYSASVEVIDLGEHWPTAIAQRVVDGEIGALFHGRMEWGPRALGNRSIIADARSVSSKRLLNESIKKRESFQPFCPSILSEEKDRLFDEAYLNKHMTSAFRLKEAFWDQLPGAIHVDGTARVQFVSPNDNPKYFELIKRVKDLTGFGVILNTSFNKHGRTIVETPEDALDDFIDTNLDFLLIEGLLVLKKKGMDATAVSTRSVTISRATI